ncbi:MAG: phytanoyl-CoA dioxygenase family protein [Bacteroidota bacterium]
MTQEQLAKQFKEQGYIYVKEALPRAEAIAFRQKIEALSGINSENFTSFEGKGDITAKLSGKKNYRLYVKPGMVTANPEFWDLPTHPNILKHARMLLGDQVKFLQNDSVAAGFSSPGWHRDSVHRTYGVGADWDESQHPYQLIRVGIYLQSHQESQFKFGVIPGSHHRESNLMQMERKQKWLTPLRSVVNGQDLFTGKGTWYATEPGDAIFFDPRLLHCGSYITGPKYSMYLAYGIENEHYSNHYKYYMHDRDDHPYERMQEGLLDKLAAAGVKPEQVLG